MRQVHADEGPGDMLVFLTGQEEIEAVQRLLLDRWACAAVPACLRPTERCQPAACVGPWFSATSAFPACRCASGQAKGVTDELFPYCGETVGRGQDAEG